MSIRRSTAYLGLLAGLGLLLWGGFSRHQVHYGTADGKGTSPQSMNISGFGIVLETSRDGLGRDGQGRLVSRRLRLVAEGSGEKTVITTDKGKGASTCPT